MATASPGEPVESTGKSFRLRNPEQLADELGHDEHGNHHVTPHTIRELARRGRIPYLRGSRRKVLFDDVAIQALLDHMRESACAAVPDPEPNLELEGNPFNFATKAGQGRGRR